MRADSTECVGKLVVWNIKLLAGIFYNLIDLWIVHMTDLRKQVMLYLKVEASTEPGNQLVAGIEVDGTMYLMNCPFVFYFVMIVVCR